MSPRRIYLDNAATSWPKPEAVYKAVERYQREIGAAAGRGSYAEALEAGQFVDRARAGVARLIGAGDPRRIVFTNSGTDGLNLAIHGWLEPGDRVVTTAAEHNSVLRPLSELERRQGVRVKRIACDAAGRVDPDDLRKEMSPETKLVAVVHASNVTGAIQPLAEIGRIAHEYGATLLVDAAQSLGHLPISVDELSIDLLAAPGHKGLLGPLGTGIVYFRPGIESRLKSFRQGGTGTRSEEHWQPESLPDKYEAGNLNVPGLAGLAAAIEFLESRGVSSIRQHESFLTDRFLGGLRQIPGVYVFGPAQAADRVGVVSLRIDGYDPQEVAAVLDATYRIQVRSGLHCAPLLHKALGTADGGGTVRFSFGAFTSEDDVDASLAAIAGIAASAAAPISGKSSVKPTS
ncbi:MAG TPA: aminotransferase class V-fold PLP-dependent enzyme [Pirellulales bacterium]|jgi:cysteine desulfurase family protein|nr:aminotransferase class V-fold PLP-dependent enzyme [Pirellulales bacterium]